MTTVSSSSTKPKKDRQTSEWVESLVDTFKQNGGLFTVFAVVLICVSGITIIDSPQNWWVSVLAIVVFFTTVFLFMNARVFLKIIATSIITIFLASFAFKIGSYADPRGTGGLVWMCATLVLFFGCLSISYLLSSGKSRWGTILTAQIISFAATYVFSLGFNNVYTGTLTGLLLGFVAYVFIYKFSSASRYSKSIVPPNLLTDDFTDSVHVAADQTSMNVVTLLGKKENTGSILVWSDKAYLLHPILMSTAFSAIGRKSLKLGYKKKNINPWLINLAFTEAPLWKSRGANIMTVLVDLENKNGNEPRVIGVTLPDTNRKLPIGILPGRMFRSNNPEVLEKAFEILQDEFSDYLKPLTTKQELALHRIGKIEEDPNETDEDVTSNKN